MHSNQFIVNQKITLFVGEMGTNGACTRQSLTYEFKWIEYKDVYRRKEKQNVGIQGCQNT